MWSLSSQAGHARRRSAVTASPRPTLCGPRSQVMRPSRGTDPDSRGSRLVSACARKQRRIRSNQASRITSLSSAGAAANRSMAASASATSPRYRAPAASRPKSRSPECRTSGGLHGTDRLSRRAFEVKHVAVAAPGPLPRGPHVDNREHEQVEAPARHMSRTCPSTSSPRSRCAEESRCTSARPIVTGRAQRNILT